MSDEPTYIIVQQPAPKRRFPRWAVLGLAALLLAGAGGTFASFTASTSNNSTFATGTLVLSDQKNELTPCLSTGAGTNTDTNDFACDQLFTLAVQKPGDSATVNITLENEGSIDASALQLFASAACSSIDDGDESYHGGGDLCDELRFSVQEWTDGDRDTVQACHFGGTTVANTCDFDNATFTAAYFATEYPDFNDVIALGTMATGALRYFTLAVALPLAAGNDVQGLEATFGVKWRIVQ